MARTENTTKAIACRVPMSDYIKFLTEASNKNMTLSEWLLVKVYSSQVNKSSHKASTSELEAKQKEVESLKTQVERLTRERNILKEKLDGADQENERLRGKISQFNYSLDEIYKMSISENITLKDIKESLFLIAHKDSR